MTLSNLNDTTDPIALGPSQMGRTLKSATTYNEPGLPTPPAGWGRKLGTSDESIAEAPDTRADDVD